MTGRRPTKAVILLGGLGTRLRPFTLETPKPLLPILNRPFFSYQLEQLKRFGIRDVVLALGYRAAHFRQYLGDGRAWGMRLSYSIEKEPLGTGGAIRKALGFLSGPVFVMNGDVLSDMDLAEIADFHLRRRAEGTLALVPVDNPSAYGLVETDRAGRILRFLEKPAPGQATTNMINAGCYLFELSVIEAIPAGRPVSIERDVFPRLVERGTALYGWRHRGYWSDVGTLKSYWAAHRDILSGVVSPAGAPRIRRGLNAERGGRIHKSVRVRGTALFGKGCRVAAGVSCEGSVSVGPGCIVGENAVLKDCVLMAAVRVGDHAVIEGSLLGASCRVGAHSRIGPGQALSPKSVLGDHTLQGADVP